jgi:hypothetical protein
VKFFIYRASSKPIGDEIQLLKSVMIDGQQYGVIEINNLSDLPREDIVIRHHVAFLHSQALEEMGLSESYVDGTLILYDDYIE